MQIEEHNYFVNLFDVYGKLLSKKQYEVSDKFFNLDLSETELAEIFGESRQSIHDAIAKAKKQLLDFEDKCGVLKQKECIFQNLTNLSKNLKKLEFEEIQKSIQNILENL